MTPVGELELVGWRRDTARMYAAVRDEPDPRAAHARWRAERDRMFREHPQSPLLPGDPMRVTGVPYWDYDPELRWTLPLQPASKDVRLPLPTDGNHTTELRLLGRLDLPVGVGVGVDVWWLEQYGGGVWIPLRDGTAAVGDAGSYGGGRYLLDTAKGADLGGSGGELVVDLNFLYHPSCRYNPEWQCPLAPAGNTTAVPVRAGERMTAG
jgi:uncharacterized protein